MMETFVHHTITAGFEIVDLEWAQWADEQGEYIYVTDGATVERFDAGHVPQGLAEELLEWYAETVKVN